MKVKKSDIRLGGLLAAIAIVLVPIYAISFGFKQNPFTYTFSMIGNRFEQMTEFIIWGVVTGGLLVFFIGWLFKNAAYKEKKARRLLIWSNVFLVLCVATPAIKEIDPISHKLHALWGGLFGISLCMAVYFFVRHLIETNNKISPKTLMYFNIVVFGSIGCLLIFGNTGIFELFFFVTLSIFLMALGKWINPGKNINNTAPGSSEKK